MIEFFRLTSIGLFQGLLPLLVFMLVLSVLQRLTFRLTYQYFGYRTVVATGIIGTTLHELAHLLMCIVFRHKIIDVSFYQPSSSDGTLGYVNYSYNPYSLYQRVGLFFVGLAPFYFGLFYVWGITYWLLGTDVLTPDLSEAELSLSLVQTTTLLFTAFGWNWQSLFWAVLSIPVILHMMPSSADLRGARTGSVVILSIYLVITGFEFINTGSIATTIETIHNSSIAVTGMLMNLMIIMVSVYVLTVLLVSAKRFIKLALRR